MANGVRATFMPALAIVAGYVLVSMGDPGWPSNSIWSFALFLWGIACCGWAGYRFSRERPAQIWAAMSIAASVSIVHWFVRGAVIAASHETSFIESTQLPLSAFGFLYTLPLVALAAWLGTKVAARRSAQ